MDSKGQAFSVFQLLIAAVVAGAILVILFQVLDRIIDPVGQDPNKIAGEVVQTQVTNTGVPAYRDVTFGRDGALSASSIANQTNSISASRICIAVSDDVPNADEFTVGDTGKALQYSGGNQQARLMVFCERGNEIEDALGAFSYDFDIPSISGACSSDFTSSSSKSCFVAVVPGI